MLLLLLLLLVDVVDVVVVVVMVVPLWQLWFPAELTVWPWRPLVQAAKHRLRPRDFVRAASLARHWKLNAAKDAARVLPRLTVSQTREAVVTHLSMKRSPTRSCARLAASVPALVDKYVPCV